jgi:cytochrome c5
MKKWMWFLTTMCSAAAVFAAGQNVSPSERGEKILNQACTNCHDLRPIDVTALDTDGWTKVVNTMIQQGAPVKPDDVSPLVEYLVANHGPLPDGSGKDIVLNTCTMCHDLQRVRTHGATRQEWEETLQAMLNEGAPLSDDEFRIVLNYLARNFRP